jgi:hypothetical protein
MFVIKAIYLNYYVTFLSYGKGGNLTEAVGDG